MIISISRERLLWEINKLSKIISYRSPIVELTGILFDVQKDKLILIGTDDFLSMKIEIKENESNLKIKSIGKALIKIRFLTEVVRKLESDTIQLEVVEGNIIRINTENFNSHLNTLNANEYRNINFEIMGKELILQPLLIKNIVSQISFAANEMNKNIIFTGIHFRFEKNKLQVTATDMFRISRKEIEFPYFDEKYEVIIPVKIIQELNRICNNNDEKISLFINNRNVIFKIQETTLQSKIIEANFPNISRIIPEEKDYMTRISINNRDLIAALERASVLSHEINNTIIKLNIDSDNIKVTSSASEIGNSNENLKTFSLIGNPMSIAFRSGYMLEAIKSFKTNSLKINLISEDKLIVLTSDEDPTLLQLVLPIRVY